MKEPEYINLLDRFSEWLRLLNFEPSTIKYAPRKVNEFLSWLESRQINEIATVNQPIITEYFNYLQSRQNKRKGGKLSKNYLRTHLTALRKLARYLRETSQSSFEVEIKLPGTSRTNLTVFNRIEIQAFYKACANDIFGIRDRAMLAVYYGCGLRRTEGISLDVDDILFNKKLLYVRKGKNYKERYVPITEAIKEDLQNYVTIARSNLIKSPSKALFLSQRGNRIGSNGMAERFQHLKEKAEINKEAGLHTLRHSIATHLLQSGMELNQIKRFLGHSSLESTQIYTHIRYEESE